MLKEKIGFVKKLLVITKTICNLPEIMNAIYGMLNDVHVLGKTGTQLQKYHPLYIEQPKFWNSCENKYVAGKKIIGFVLLGEYVEFSNDNPADKNIERIVIYDDVEINEDLYKAVYLEDQRDFFFIEKSQLLNSKVKTY